MFSTMKDFLRWDERLLQYEKPKVKIEKSPALESPKKENWLTNDHLANKPR